MAWLPGAPATSGDVLLVLSLLVLLWMCIACRISTYPAVAAGIGMTITQLTIFAVAWQLMRSWGISYDVVLLAEFTSSDAWAMDIGHWLLFILLLLADAASTLVAVPATGALVRRLIDPAGPLPCSPPALLESSEAPTVQHTNININTSISTNPTATPTATPTANPNPTATAALNADAAAFNGGSHYAASSGITQCAHATYPPYRGAVPSVSRLSEYVGSGASVYPDESYDRWLTGTDLARPLPAAPSVTVLLPCYMPNEKGLIIGTINHIRRNLEYPIPFTLLVCYNTPRDLPDIEKKLRAMDGKVDGKKNNLLKVLRVEGSTSKAENLNAALREVSSENVVIYDADHHPDPDSLKIMTRFMIRHNAACVQGSTYIRVCNTLMALLVDAEFFLIFFVFFPAIQTATGMGWFGGSNALWRANALRINAFRRDVQTEDIELSTRLLVGNNTILICPEARSGELPPATFAALWKQRVRWLTGWDQVTLRHFSTIYRSRTLHPCKKLALFYILPARWLMLVLALVNAFSFPVLNYVMGIDHNGLGWPIVLCINYGFTCAITVFIVTMISAVVYEYKRPLHIVFVLIFQLLSLLYLIWQLVLLMVSCFRICTGNVNDWVVTDRGGMAVSSTRESKPLAPLSQPTPEEAVSADVSSVPRVEPPRRCIPKVLGFLFSRPHSQWRDDREALV